MKGLVADFLKSRDLQLAEKDKKELKVSLIGLDGVVSKALFSYEVTKKERPGG